MGKRPLHISFKKLAAATAMLGLFIGSPALAEGIDELRFGGTWMNPDFLEISHPEADQAAVSAEILFSELNLDTRTDAGDDFINTLLTPRIHVGANYNFDDNGTSYVYAGLTWHKALTETLFVEASFGGALNDGEDAPTATRAGLGSSLTFREGLALGYNINEQMTALIFIEHLSHAELAGSNNRGLSNTGFKLGYKF